MYIFSNFSNFSPLVRPVRPVRPVVLAVLASLSAVAAAQHSVQSDADTGAALPDVTVSASGLQLGSGDMATPVTILEGDHLMRQRQSTLGETLRGEPGIHSSHFGAGASRPIIRGMDGPRVKILHDGAEVHDASTVSPDHAVASEPLLATQVEVLRGPSALVHGGAAVGGVVNVLDGKIPTAIPTKGYEGSIELRANTGAHEGAGAFALTGGAGAVAVHVEGALRDAQDYRVGRGWMHGEHSDRNVPGSFTRNDTGSIGLSWIGTQGYVGVAFTRYNAHYGLPGHDHDLEGCHTHGNHLHCGTHGNEDGSDAAHEHEQVPVVDLRSERWDMRGQWRAPFAGISAIRLRASSTDYRHDEVEAGTIATTFKNKAHDVRLELQHDPVAGWRGVWGLQSTRRTFSALGEEAYVEPTETERTGLFVLEEYRWQDWRFEAAVRHDRQSAYALDSATRRSHHGTSASLGAVWKFQPGYALGASITRASRAPTAEELYASGLHMATATYERGNINLRSETAQNIDLSLKKTQGDTTFGLSVFHNRMNDYIYGRTLDALNGLQLVQYSQADARFTGMEGHVRQRLNRQWHVTVFGDTVRARLNDGSALPRIAPARAGLRLDTRWGNGWHGHVQWVHTARQNRVAAFETHTSGFGMLAMGLSYEGGTIGNSAWQWYFTGTNLTNRLAYAHTSFIKTAAPLMGRNLSMGVKLTF